MAFDRCRLGWFEACSRKPTSKGLSFIFHTAPQTLRAYVRDTRSPGSPAGDVRTCQGLGPRRTVRGLALTPPSVLPSAVGNASASRITKLSRLNGWPARSPADASPIPSRGPPHGLGPMWFAIPSSQWTLTTYSLPVSRRTPTVPGALVTHLIAFVEIAFISI